MQFIQAFANNPCLEIGQSYLKIQSHDKTKKNKIENGYFEFQLNTFCLILASWKKWLPRSGSGVFLILSQMQPCGRDKTQIICLRKMFKHPLMKSLYQCLFSDFPKVFNGPERRSLSWVFTIKHGHLFTAAKRVQNSDIKILVGPILFLINMPCWTRVVLSGSPLKILSSCINAIKIYTFVCFIKILVFWNPYKSENQRRFTCRDQSHPAQALTSVAENGRPEKAGPH